MKDPNNDSKISNSALDEEQKQNISSFCWKIIKPCKQDTKKYSLFFKIPRTKKNKEKIFLGISVRNLIYYVAGKEKGGVLCFVFVFWKFLWGNIIDFSVFLFRKFYFSSVEGKFCSQEVLISINIFELYKYILWTSKNISSNMNKIKLVIKNLTKMKKF